MSEKFYNLERVKLRRRTFSQLKSDILFEKLFFDLIRKNLCHGQTVLDIGTGNGYVLKELDLRFPELEVSLVGLDKSTAMIEEARTLCPRGNFYVGDNFDLPFLDNQFDLVTAKNVTRFSPDEVYRVINSGGAFILREYGKGKGLVEIADMFSSRLIRSRDPNFYLRTLQRAGFIEVSLQQYKFLRKYSLHNLLAILESFPFIKGYSKRDVDRICKKYSSEGNIMITSDPIIVTARKNE
jgi:ubiquinone/menaquinone biosynthesis C-methylase UbiE